MNQNERRIVEGGDSPQQRKAGDGAKRAILALAGGAGLFVLGSIAFDLGILGDDGSHPTNSSERESDMAAAYFSPPAETSIPDGPDGDAIRRGMALFVNTKTNAADFVGNELSCASCHLDKGREPNSAPMWAAYVIYPKYRSKNKQINTMEDRLRGCFTYSMNGQDSPSGGPPPAGHPIYKDLQMYFHWLASGAPVGESLPGQGYPELEKTALGYDPQRGAQVYEQNCAACHGSNGQGQRDLNGKLVFPPLWGPNSYNWGAGMARVNTAASFIKANMPMGQGGTLTDQEAWDAAAFIDSQERPRDPRQTGSVADNAAANHGQDTYYGKIVEGRLLGTGTGR